MHSRRFAKQSWIYYLRNNYIKMSLLQPEVARYASIFRFACAFAYMQASLLNVNKPSLFTLFTFAFAQTIESTLRELSIVMNNKPVLIGDKSLRRTGFYLGGCYAIFQYHIPLLFSADYFIDLFCSIKEI